MPKDFKDKTLAKKAAKRIDELSADLDNIKIMHVCGTHENSIARYGIRSLLPDNIEIVSGPGCPVCVTTQKEIDEAITLATEGKIITTFGDMLRVTGSQSSLSDAQAMGHDVRIVYSPDDAMDIARKNPDKEILHIAVGFETTAPSTAAQLKLAAENFSVLCCHRTISPAFEFLLGSENLKIDAFIDPGHVAAITGSTPYREIAQKYSSPHVIAGFEPLDLLFAIVMILGMLKDKVNDVENEYSRAVRPEGNIKAQRLITEVFKPCDIAWRGFPVIPKSGMKLRKKYLGYDAREKFSLNVEDSPLPGGCRCADVLKGQIYPEECPLFGRKCTPKDPIGPCMVSTEGSCSIAYRYKQLK